MIQFPRWGRITYACTDDNNGFHFISFHFIYYIISHGTKKKQLQNETDIKNANMFKWYNDYTRHNYTK